MIVLMMKITNNTFTNNYDIIIKELIPGVQQIKKKKKKKEQGLHNSEYHSCDLRTDTGTGGQGGNGD